MIDVNNVMNGLGFTLVDESGHSYEYERELGTGLELGPLTAVIDLLATAKYQAQVITIIPRDGLCETDDETYADKTLLAIRFVKLGN